MAWIKVRTTLWDDPRVSRMVELTGTSEAQVVGALYWLWSMADSHTADGILPGLTMAGVDRKTGVSGIASALCAVGWMADHPEGVRIINFEEHNGASAKRRALEAQRKGGVRKVSASRPQNVRIECGQNADTMRTKCGHHAELDKIREETTEREIGADEIEQGEIGQESPASASEHPQAPKTPSAPSEAQGAPVPSIPQASPETLWLFENVCGITCQGNLGDWLRNYPEDWIRHALLAAEAKAERPRSPVAYCKRMLEDYQRNGGPDNGIRRSGGSGGGSSGRGRPDRPASLSERDDISKFAGHPLA